MPRDSLRYRLNDAPLRRFAVLVLGSLLATPCLADWPALKKLQAERGVTVSALVQDLGTGETLAKLGAQRRLSPASLSKLVLASAVLETWPGDHRFVTRVQGAFPNTAGLVVGDLWISGEGDPSFEHRDLWMLAARLKQAGVRKLEGDIVASALPFGRIDCETKDRCDALERTRTAYDAPLAAIGVDYGTWCIDLAPQLPGQPASVHHCAAFEVPIPQLGSITSRAPRQRAATPWLDRRSWAGDDQLVMGGDLSRPTRLYRSMGDPALGAALLLRQALAELGIEVPGGVRVSDFPPPSGLPELTRHEGAAIREQVSGLLRYSNNYISDVLTLGIALGRTPEPVTSLEQASRLLEARVLRARAAAGLPPPSGKAPVLMLSGSGLTPENRLSAEDLVALLEDEYRHTARFPRFYAGLVVPGEAPNALLRRGNAAWRERVALKTGTLSVPRSVFGTAGYLRKRDGGWMAFAVIVNGADRKPVPMSVSLHAIRRDVEALLARH